MIFAHFPEKVPNCAHAANISGIHEVGGEGFAGPGGENIHPCLCDQHRLFKLGRQLTILKESE